MFMFIFLSLILSPLPQNYLLFTALRIPFIYSVPMIIQIPYLNGTVAIFRSKTNEREREESCLPACFFPFVEFILFNTTWLLKANRSCNIANIQFFMQIKVCFPIAPHRVSTFFAAFSVVFFSLRFSVRQFVFDVVLISRFFFLLFRSFWIAIFQLSLLIHLFT